MKTILVPIDFSKPSIAALDTAYSVAEKFKSSITLLHVVEEAAPDSFKISGEGHPDDFEDRIFTRALIAKAKKSLTALVKSPKYAGVEVKGELRLGNAFHGMRTIISEHKVDLVVMGTRGHSRLEEMVIGTNTERVVRHSKCPVLSVHTKPALKDVKNVVYATSLSDNEAAFSRVVRNVQEAYGATVHLVRINTPNDFQRDRVVLPYMEKFAKAMRLKNYTLNVFNERSAEEGILYFADSINADLIAMATHGRTGFAHVLAGSIAEDVVGHARTPVLTYVTRHKRA